MSARYIAGDVLEVLRAMPAGSVDLVLSSPPFLALRSYFGSEPTPGAFIDTLLDVIEECRRVLAPHGSLCFELGDTYAGSGGAGGDYAEGLRAGQPVFDGSASGRRRALRQGYGGAADRLDAEVPKKGDGWPLDKSLCLIPELLRIAMVYGVNPLTGRATPRWRARNVVRWCRPNPPVGALGDKVRPATSDIIVACVDRKRYFDLDAVRVRNDRTDENPGGHHRRGEVPPNSKGGGDFTNPAKTSPQNPGGAPPLDHWWVDEDTFDQDAWHIPTHGYPGSHYATWAPALLVKPILAMCSAKVCTTCGKPSERITTRTAWEHREHPLLERQGIQRGGLGTHGDRTANPTTTGWTDCGHGTWRNGVVLDPFGGSGTTAVVALGHGRDAVLIDLDERNAALASARVGMWLDVEQHTNEQEVPT